MIRTDTIAAIATPVATGAVGIVRVSGNKCIEVLRSKFSAVSGEDPADFLHGKLYFGSFDCGRFSDRCLAVLFRAPKSFTGEDVAEIQCHGGVEIVRGVLASALSCGVRMAEPGEFTKRAFLNGKQDLSACEGIGDLISAESAAEAGAAGMLERGELFRKIDAMQSSLTDLISKVEVLLDYPEEDLEEAGRAEIQEALGGIRAELIALSAGYETGRKIKAGISAVLCGRTNAGKSSLFNSLLRFDRAIVTDVPGTTRDTVEGFLEVDGIKVRLTDTAGIRESADPVEKIGISRSVEEIAGADIVLFVLDDQGFTVEDREILNRTEGKPVLFVLNKSDLKKVAAPLPEEFRKDSIAVSAKTGENVGRLREEILERTLRRGAGSGLLLTNERHFEAVSRSGRIVEETLAGLSDKYADALALELKTLWDALGEITGTTATEAIIDNIFRKFCLGK